MLQTRISNPREIEAVVGPEPQSLQQTAAQAVALFGRQYPIIIFTMLLCIGFAGVYLLTATKRYTGTAVLMIDSRKMQGLQTQETLGSENPIDSAMVDSQVEILKSETIASAVIKDLRLLDLPEFTGSEGGSLLGSIARIFSELSSDPGPSDFQLMRMAVTRLQNQLSVKRVGNSYVIEIGYQSLSPAEAAAIANAFAEAYIVDSLESKYQASRRAAVWLQDRMKELRAQASTAERAVADYKAKNNIVDAGGRLLTEQQLGEINSALTIARAQRAEAEAKLERITAILKADDNDRNVINDLGTVADTMQNPVIVKLRQTYLDYAAKEADWSAHYGPMHLAVVNLRNQMREIRRSIIDELRRTAEGYKSDFEIAKAREEASQKSLNDTIALSNDTSQAQIVLKDLESNAQSARALADNFLQLYMVSVQQQSFPITEARVITRASVPLSQSSPKTLFVLLGAIIGGTMLASFVGVVREMMDRVFRTVPQVEQLLRASCVASIPIVERNMDPDGKSDGARRIRKPSAWWWPFTKSKKTAESIEPVKSIQTLQFRKTEPALDHPRPGTERVLSARDSVARTVIDSPFSRFAEGVRSINLATDLGHFGSAANKVVGITSALPNEGKSTISEALAQVAAQSGSRTLLVDGDIRNPSLTLRLTPDAKLGLIDIVLGKALLQDVVWVDPQTNLHFVPCVVASRFSNSADVLASSQMEKLFKQLREHYDRIVLDLSPMAPVIDVRATGGLVDCYVLVIEWAKGKIDIVERVLNETPAVQERLLGAVLNKVNMAVMSRYDSYHGGYYHNSYYKRYGYID